MSGNKNFSRLISLVQIFISVIFLRNILVNIIVLSLVQSFYLQLFYCDVTLQKLVAIVLQIDYIISGNVQKPNHDIEPLLIHFQDIVNPNQHHKHSVENRQCQ